MPWGLLMHEETADVHIYVIKMAQTKMQDNIYKHIHFPKSNNSVIQQLDMKQVSIKYTTQTQDYDYKN
jgi:hypothetical protein